MDTFWNSYEIKTVTKPHTKIMICGNNTLMFNEIETKKTKSRCFLSFRPSQIYSIQTVPELE